MDALLIIGYIVLASIIVFLSIKLSDYVDMLDKTTKISGAVLGGILLAAVTSLPELFTTMTAVIGVGETQYVIGNILGSDIFNIMILGVLILIFFKNYRECRIAKCQIWQFICLIGLFGITALATFLPSEIKNHIVLGGFFNVISLGILIFYFISIFKLDKTEVKAELDENTKILAPKQLIIRFVIAAVLLISASIGVTYVSDMIVEKYNINATIAGALLLGVMTSLPEVISTFNLFLKKNINAGFGNIVGSCVFNFLVIFLGELFSFNGTVFENTAEGSKLILFGIIAVFSCFALLLFKFWFDKKKDSKKGRVVLSSVMIFLSLVTVSSYILYLLLPSKFFIF